MTLLPRDAAEAGGPLAFLLVDDDDVDREAVRRALRAAGLDADVVEAADAPEALDALRARAFDVVLLDYRLPKADGLAVLTEARAAGVDVPFVLLTGRGDEQLAVAIMKAGASDYLVKAGLTPARLAQSVRAAVRTHRAERRARQAAHDALALAEAIPHLVWTTTPDLVALYVNRRWVEYTGLDLEAARREGGAAAVHPDDVAAVLERWREAVRASAPFEAEYRLRGADGAYRWFLGRAFPRDDGATPAAWFGTCTDVDDQKRAEDERRRLLAKEEEARRALEEAHRTKDEFLAVVSHELRTPLNAILGWAQLLGDEGLPADQRRRAVEAITRSAGVQKQLIEDLLDLSRVVAGKMRLTVGPTDLALVARAALDVVRPAARAKGIALEEDIDGRAGALLADAERLQQVAWNLLANAVKFTPEGGRVALRLRRESDRVELEVGDTGRGIDPAFLPHLFEMFRQAEGASSRAQGGLGLGLAIVRHLVELHGGTVRVRSDGPGKGTTFTVCLPVTAPPVAAGDRVPSPVSLRSPSGLEPKPGLASKRALIVDDEEDARDMLAAALRLGGLEVNDAGSADEAMQSLLRAPPDVLVSDIGMPGEDGYALLRRVRALPREQGGAVPAVALTAFARAEDRAAAHAAGFDLHVVKPVDPTELLDALARLIAAGRARP